MDDEENELMTDRKSHRSHDNLGYVASPLVETEMEEEHDNNEDEDDDDDVQR